MTGAGSLGELALGQKPGATTVTTTLIAAAGSFVETGEAATFQTQQVSAVGTFAETGIAAMFQTQEIAAVGSFALTGQGVIFDPTEMTGFGAFALTGFAATFQFTEFVAFGAYRLTGQPATYSLEFNRGSIGSSMTAGSFSRKRWHDLQNAREAERLREIGAKAARKAAKRKAREIAAAEAARARAERRAQIGATAAEQARAATIAHLLHGAQQAGGHIVPGPDLLGAARDHAAVLARAIAQDDEEVLLHFVMMPGKR